VLAWLRLYHSPSRSPLVTPEERSLIERAQADSGAPPAARIPWLRLLRARPVLGLMVAKVLTDSSWFFLIFWLPKYLTDMRHFNLKQIGAFSWIPFGFSGFGSLLGGALGTYLIGRGFSLDRARKLALLLPALLMPSTLLITSVSIGPAIVLFSVALFAHQFWSANVQTIAADMFPSSAVGSVAGLLGAAGALGAAGFGLIVGKLVASSGYGIPLAVGGVVHALSYALILLIVRRIEPVRASLAD
jgi:ACS family hexuronate transporter-like MFS transporter